MGDNEWLLGLDEEDQFLARIVGAESEEDYEAIPLSVRNAWRNTYRNIEDKEQSLESLKKAGVIDDDIYNSAKAAGYDGENFSDITPEQWREIYNGYIEGYNAFAKEHPDVPYRFRNQDRYRAQWDKSYDGYVGKQQEQRAQPAQPAEPQGEAPQQEENKQGETAQEEVEPLEVRDVQNKPFPEANVQEPGKVRMQIGEPQRLDVKKEDTQPKQVTLPDEEQDEYRRKGGIFEIARGAKNEEPAQAGKNEEPAQEATQSTEKAATPEEGRGYTPVAPWQKEQPKEEGRGYGYNIFDDLRQMRKEEENPQQSQQQTTEQPKQETTQARDNGKLPEEEQQEYTDNGGVMPMSGTNDSYSRQRRNRNVEPVKQADDAVGASAGNTVGNAAGTTAEAGTKAAAGTDGSAEEEIVVEEVKPIKQESPRVVQVTDTPPRPRTTPAHIQTREEWEAEQAGKAASGTSQTTTSKARTPEERTTPIVKPVTTTGQGEEGMARQREQTTQTKPAATSGNTQTSVADYQGIIDYINRLNKAADEEEAEGKRINEEKAKRTAKRRMLLAGIADAANSFHQAYAYARGIKPMNDNRGYAKEVKKEIRDDLEWIRKNKDRVLNYRAKAAELEKVLASLRNAEGELAYKRGYLKYLNDNKDYKEWKAQIDDAYRNRKQDFAEFAKKEELKLKKEWQEHKIGYDEYKQKMDWLKLFTEEDVEYVLDELGDKTGEHRSKSVNVNAANGAQGNSNAGNSNAGGTNGNGNGGTSNSGNTPPSRQKQEDNTPPSRRRK